jgi:hypothetical protein
MPTDPKSYLYFRRVLTISCRIRKDPYFFGADLEETAYASLQEGDIVAAGQRPR